MKVQSTGKPVEQIVAAIQTLDLDPIKVKLMDPEEGQGWSREYLDQTEIEYRRFLTLSVKYPEETIATSKDVDKFWHGHILDTLKYAEDCQNVFGYFLHHFPYFGMRGQEDAANLAEAGKTTNRLYEREFGKAVPGGAAYCSVAIAKPAYCSVAATGEKAAYCSVSIANSAYCSVAATGEKAAYCSVSIAKPAYCSVAATGEKAAYCSVSIAKPAYCSVAANGEKAAYCSVSIAKPAYCSVAANGEKAAYCSVSIAKPAYCSVAATGEKAAYCSVSIAKQGYCSVAATGEKTSYCSVAIAKPAYCSVAATGEQAAYCSVAANNEGVRGGQKDKLNTSLRPRLALAA